ncbi:MAG: lytic transglycosylase domain-containing protein [Clostridia bacterium]|nr:lytic transglycosylase domain-containing protein [Clostridia bacterium]
MKDRTKNIIKLSFAVLILLVVSVIITVNSVSLVLQTVYPREYSDLIESYAEAYDIDKSLLYALVECESGFDKNAVSSVGAKGLTQITPETFQWLQTKTGEDYTDDALFEPEISVKYGAFFLSMLLDEFGDTKTALAAYHAGRGKVNEWLDNTEYSSDGKKLDEIPFEDTALYAGKVMKVREWYCKIYKMEDTQNGNI